MSSVLETVGPRSGTAPLVIAITDPGEVDLATVFAHFDGTGAGGSFVPAVTIKAQDGTVLGRLFPSQTLAAGDTADVTFAPFLRALNGGSITLTGSDGIVVTPTVGGYDIAADLQGSGWSAIIVKSVDESVTNSAAVQNDDELFFTAASGAFYEIELLVVYAGLPANGILYDLGEDATVRGNFWRLGWTTVTNQGAINAATADRTLVSEGAAAGGVQRGFLAKGIYRGGGGVFRFRWAQNGANVSPMTVYAGSILRYRRFLN